MRLKNWLWIGLAGFMAVPTVQGQESGESNADLSEEYRFGLSVDAVHLAATVINKKGRIVTDLEQQDFLVYEEGVPQAISYFARGTDAPVDVLLLVDASGSMDMVSKVSNARNAAIQLISVLEAEDRVAVYGFDSGVFELCGFTEDKLEAVEALKRLKPFGATAIHDAVAEISGLIRDMGFGRRAIVLITDGVDTASKLSVDRAVELAKGVDLPVFVIRVLSPLDDPANDAFVGVHGERAGRGEGLGRFADETGGRLYEASQIGMLHVASLRVKEELKTQYRLAYVPRDSRPDGRFRRIEVYVRLEDVEVRTRKGYFAREPVAGHRGAESVSNQDSK